MRLNLETLLAEGKTIYVRNMTNPRGKIVINFYDPGSRKAVPVHIPRTTLPICVSDQVPKAAIEASSDFRRFLVKGIVTLVDPKQAEEELGTADAQEELQDLQQSDYANAARSTAGPKIVQGERHGPSDDTDIEVVSVNPRVMTIIASVNEGEMQVRTAVQELRAVKDQLREEDLSYILTNSQRGGKLHEFSSTMLAELNKPASSQG